MLPAVPLRPRHDGWTAERQARFLELLETSGSVAAAARAVGMSASSAYRLRARANAQAFAQAWDEALAVALAPLELHTLQRAIEGDAKPLYSGGRVIGTQRVYDTRLTLYLLKLAERRDAERRADPPLAP